MKNHLFLLLFVVQNSFAQTSPDPQIYLADPAILYFEGIYYLYGTVEGNASDGFQVYTSKDQKS